MYFTLLYEQPEGPTTIYELVFHPCPLWMSSEGEVICNTEHRGPRYVLGDFCFFHNKQSFVSHGEGRKISIVCHDSGNGNEEDLNLMIADMESLGYSPQLLSSV